ncbi:hypothetical protein J4Q44_G00307580 [Coregonus suidteri]|uniref:Probable tRNA(His) guanylyltransferase n=1 Tax=Coregonus suidteri TaxID=861788 RepID=A0AAN8KWK1_9TELE
MLLKHFTLGFAEQHNFLKPNDDRALGLMTRSARSVMEDLDDIIISYGQSDEFSFVFKWTSNWFKRRASSPLPMCSTGGTISETSPSSTPQGLTGGWFCILATATSGTTSAGGRLTVISTTCITVFWTLVQKGGLTTTQAEDRLKGTLAADKNEIMFSEFDINYNKEPLVHRKGTTLIWEKLEETVTKTVMLPNEEKEEEEEEEVPVTRTRRRVSAHHCDVIGDQFWEEHPHILEDDNC